MARHLARRRQDRGHHVVTARLDGLVEGEEVCLSVAAALGVLGPPRRRTSRAAVAGRKVVAATT